MNDLQITRYTTEFASETAALIETCFAEYRDASPLTFLEPTEPWIPRADLLETLTSDRLHAEASHVVLEDGVPISAALAVRSGDGCGWWRIATASDHRRRGLASACIEAGESALKDARQQSVQTNAVVDSRWEPAGALFASLGYNLEDPEERNITMATEKWTPQPVELPEGYSLDTFREEDLRAWIDIRNAIFEDERGEDWFRKRFMNRSDYDAEGWKMLRHEGQVVGISSAVCVESHVDPAHLRGAQLEWVGVLPKHRGLQLGECLVVACMNHAAERDFLPMLLITQPFRAPAISLYEKLGFRIAAAWHSWTKELN